MCACVCAWTHILLFHFVLTRKSWFPGVPWTHPKQRSDWGCCCFSWAAQESGLDRLPSLGPVSENTSVKAMCAHSVHIHMGNWKLWQRWNWSLPALVLTRVCQWNTSHVSLEVQKAKKAHMQRSGSTLEDAYLIKGNYMTTLTVSSLCFNWKRLLIPQTWLPKSELNLEGLKSIKCLQSYILLRSRRVH